MITCSQFSFLHTSMWIKMKINAIRSARHYFCGTCMYGKGKKMQIHLCHSTHKLFGKMRWPFFTWVSFYLCILYHYSTNSTNANIAESEQSSHTPAIAIRGILKKFCRSKFLIFAHWRYRKKKKNKGTSIFWLLVLVYTIDEQFAHVCIRLQLCRPYRKVW